MGGHNDNEVSLIVFQEYNIFIKFNIIKVFFRQNINFKHFISSMDIIKR